MDSVSQMTEEIFRSDAYLKECSATVVAVDGQGIVLDRTVFYPQGGGQAGDSGVLLLADGSELAVADTRKRKDEEGRPTHQIAHVPAEGQQHLLMNIKPGDSITAHIA